MEFPGGAVVSLSCVFTAKGLGSIPGQGTKVLQMARPKKKKTKTKKSNFILPLLIIN